MGETLPLLSCGAAFITVGNRCHEPGRLAGPAQGWPDASRTMASSAKKLAGFPGLDFAQT
jgi:hypothetical protein